MSSYYSILSNSEVIERRSLHPRTRFFVCVALLYEFEISWQYQKQVDALLLPLKRVKPVWAPTSFNSFLGRTNDLKVLKFGVQYFLGFFIFCCFHASYGQNSYIFKFFDYKRVLSNSSSQKKRTFNFIFYFGITIKI